METHLSGVKLHYEKCGSGEKRVVLLHGWGCSTELMKPVAQALAPDMTVLLVDFPAHGGSSQPPEPWGVPEFAACLKELLIQLDFLPCSVIAHSFGGRITIELASADTEMFDRIILTGAAGIRDRADEKSKQRKSAYQRRKQWVERARRMRIFGSLTDRWQEALVQKYGSRDYAALTPEMRKTFVKVVNYDQSEKLHAIRNSTLLVWGDRDTETPLWMGQQMEREIPDSALVVLDGGTHFAYLEQGARFNAIARSFLVETN